MNDNAKKALAKAIRNFFTEDEILSEDYLTQAAQDYVYEHDEEIKEHLRDQLCIDEIFEDALSDLAWYEIW